MFKVTGWFFNSFVVDKIEIFVDILKEFHKDNFDFGGLFIIIVSHATNAEIQEIFKKLWNLYVINVNMLVNGSVYKFSLSSI